MFELQCLHCGLQALPSAAQKVTNFDSDMSNGLALAALLMSHWPELAPLGGQLRANPTSKADAQHNAGIVVKMMEELQLPYNLQASHSIRTKTYVYHSSAVWRLVCLNSVTNNI